MENFRVELEVGSKTVKIESNDKELLNEIVTNIIKKENNGSSKSRDVLDGYCEELNKSFESVEEAKKSFEETRKKFEDGRKERSERLNKAIKDAEEAIKENGKSIENAQPETNSINGLDVDDAFEENRKEIRKELDDLFATLDSMKD